MNKLITGHDYGEVFGLTKESGKKMIYNGGDSWTGLLADGTGQTMDSPATTAKVVAYISNHVDMRNGGRND
jgi:hypothetical protein